MSSWISRNLKMSSWKYKNSLTGHILGNLTSNSNKIYKMTQKNYLKPPQTNLVSNFRLKVKIIFKKSCLIIMSILWRHIVNLKKNLFCRTILHTVSLIYQQISSSNTADCPDFNRYGLLVEKLPLEWRHVCYMKTTNNGHSHRRWPLASRVWLG